MLIPERVCRGRLSRLTSLSPPPRPPPFQKYASVQNGLRREALMVESFAEEGAMVTLDMRLAYRDDSISEWTKMASSTVERKLNCNLTVSKVWEKPPLVLVVSRCTMPCLAVLPPDQRKRGPLLRMRPPALHGGWQRGPQVLPPQHPPPRERPQEDQRGDRGDQRHPARRKQTFRPSLRTFDRGLGRRRPMIARSCFSPAEHPPKWRIHQSVVRHEDVPDAQHPHHHDLVLEKDHPHEQTPCSAGEVS